MRVICLRHLSPYGSPGLIRLIGLARPVTLFSLTYPCASFLKLHTQWKRMTTKRKKKRGRGRRKHKTREHRGEESGKRSRGRGEAGEERGARRKRMEKRKREERRKVIQTFSLIRSILISLCTYLSSSSGTMVSFHYH